MATPRTSSAPAPLRVRLITAAIFVATVLVALAGTLARFYTDLAWFRDLGQEAVFWTRLWSELGAGWAFGLVSFVVILANLLIARRLSPPVARVTYPDSVALTPPQQIEEFLARIRGVLEPYVTWVILAVAVMVSWGIGSSMAASWQELRLALASVSFGIPDPQFGMDVAFYVFKLPALRIAEDWLGEALIVTLLLSALVYLYDGSIRPAERLRGIDSHVKAHLSVLAALLVAAKGLDYWLSVYELNFSPRGQVLGASFTDVNAQIPAYFILMAIAVVTIALLMLNIRYRGWRLPLVALGVWIGASVLVGAVYPALIQQLQVSPNELVAEAPYIKRNITATRAAFDLESIEATSFPAATDLSAADMAEATSTVKNVRLWDPAVVIDSYKQLQEIRFYYDFNDVDIDRYDIDGQRRQTLISAREMNVEQLEPQAKTWINNHLVYTHGYGVVLSPVNEASIEGLPKFIVKDLPPKSSADIGVKTPGIYFGEETSNYAVVDTLQKEFDYPVGGENATTSYEGKNGVPVGSFLDRLAFTLRFGDVELLFSTAITPRSRILFNRSLKDRVTEIAPWLVLDSDPYPVITKAGRVVWVMDGYTWSSYYPYSQRYGTSRINYMRNSVKITVDAYDGTTTFYAFDEKDPVLAAYRSIYPGLFTDAVKMPADIRAHLRYPEDLFTMQAEVYKTYHMLDPQVFYNKEDQWALPGEKTDQPMVPFYVLMTLPGETHEDFLLMQPFTPRTKDNMIGWMAAKCDPSGYGRRIVYNFPKQRLILGPQQVRARLNQEPDISKELTLLNQQGSRVRFGNLLVIPIRDSIVYIMPLYIQAEQSPMPELKRVIVAYADRIAMDSDLNGALLKVFGAAPAVSQPSTQTPSSGGTTAPVGSDAARARDLFQKAVAAQRAGDWAAYGDYIKQLGEVLDRIARPSAATTSTK